MLSKEWQAILKHKFFVVVIVALSLIPAIYNYVFLGSMWNPYGNINHLPVAVVNQDKSAELNGKKLSMGKSTISEMKKGMDMDYHFVSKSTADKGLKSGKYYMEIVFPENFSDSVASLTTNTPKTARLVYQTTRGHNYISSKMSESAMNKLKSKVSENITKSYTEALFSSITTLKSGMSDAADGSKKLADGGKDALSGSQKISTNLDTLSKKSLTFADGTNRERTGLNQYVAGVEAVRNGTQQLTDGNQQLSAKLGEAAQGTQKLQDLSQKLIDELTKLGTALSPENQAAVNEAITSLNDMIGKINNVDTKTIQSELKKDLTSVQGILPEIVKDYKDQISASITAVSQTKAFQSLNSDQQNEIINALKNSANTGNVPTDITNISTNLIDVENQLNKLESLMDGMSKFTYPANPKEASLSEKLGEFSQGLNDASARSKELFKGAQDFKANIAKLNSGLQQLNQGAKNIVTKSAPLTSGLDQLHINGPQLTDGMQTIDGAAGQMSSGAQQLNTGSQKLTTGLNSLNSGLGTLSNKLEIADQKLSSTETKKKNADSIAKPLAMTHKDSDNVAENGAGMAPYMISVALFIGALATNVVVGTGFSDAKRKNGWDFMWAKIGTNGVIAVLQALIIFGALYALGLRPSYPLETLGVIILISLTYMAIVTFFVTALGKVGDFLMIVLLVMQLATSAGTYPLQLAPKIYQTIGTWLPMTYALRMTRETIGLTGNVGPDFLLFIVLTVVFTLLLAGFRTGKASRFA